MANGHGGSRAGAGRPKGVGLPSGAVRAIQAAAVVDELDPQGQEAIGVILEVMRKPTRHAMSRLGAARELLDRRRGKPAQQVQVSGHLSLVDLVEASGLKADE